MSALHEAARRVVSAWVSTRPAWIEQCNAAVLALDAALKAQAGCDTETDCTSQPWCRISGECHRKQKQPEPKPEQPENGLRTAAQMALEALEYGQHSLKQ
ncbi:MAG: hypothetical protein KGR68_17680, partial [Betaproteobacteria bacterium]|nr:hypothetical protein [Betaproteobacteria bacterium]